jgi:outer membrane protein OmpA-like peptidoglycan-associated protein
MFGGGQPGPPVSATCTINPAEVMVGEPATATAAVSGFHPKHTLSYTWSSTGGQITGKDNTASLNTNGVAGGSYTVTANIVDPKAEKNGTATCSANFTVKETTKNPPTMTCYPSPSTLQAGGSATVACSCTSPDNVPVTVGDWSATGGTITGSGSTATLNTAGASAGVITVSATCTDSRGLKSPPTTTQVTVENPSEVKQLEGRLALHSIYFPTAQPTVANPNGGLLDSQQQTLISLADDFKKYLGTRPDAHLTLEGHADPRASVEYNQALSERRVERTKRFLVEHGVPSANIETKAFGKQQNLTEAQVKDAVEQNPELTPGERQRVLNNMTTILLASNRRVDIALSTTGQQSLRQYPFNAADSLTLIRQAETKKTAGPAAKKKATPKVQQ